MKKSKRSTSVALPFPSPLPFVQNYFPYTFWFFTQRWLPWVIYSILVLLLVPRHEPWFDEAQAWLLARDVQWTTLMTTFLRYEGTPGLWHTILHGFARNGAPYETINYISGALGIAAAYLIVMLSPFPTFLRWILPFTFFIAYQYTIVARNYSLLAILLMALAFLYPERKKKTYAYITLLILLANVSLHAFLAAGCIALLYFIEAFQERKKTSKAQNRINRNSFIAYCIANLLIIAICLPNADVISPTEVIMTQNYASQILTFMSNGAFAGYWPFTISLFAVSFWWFRKQGVVLLFVLPMAAVLGVFTIICAKPWHQGILFLIWLFVLWVSFDRGWKKASLRERTVLVLGILPTLIVQLTWSYNSYHYDYYEVYSGSRQAAAYMAKNKLEDRTMFATNFVAPAMSAYFTKNPFANLNNGQLPSFFWWSKKYNFQDHPDYVQMKKPEFLLVSIKMRPDMKIGQIPGYRIVRGFQGYIYWKTMPFENESYILLRRQDVDIQNPGKSPSYLPSVKKPNAVVKRDSGLPKTIRVPASVRRSQYSNRPSKISKLSTHRR